MKAVEYDKAHEAKAQEQFESWIADHEMKVIRDDGLYRHLRCARPDSGFYSFNVITWPGYLAAVGDIADGFVFCRLDDMFQFFASGKGINAPYWGEKRVASRNPLQTFDEAKFHATMADHLTNEYLDFDGEDPGRADRIRVAWKEHIEFEDLYSKHQAMELVSAFEAEGYRFEDYYELDFEVWDVHYLYACHAIRWAVRRYRDLVPTEAGGEQ